MMTVVFATKDRAHQLELVLNQFRRLLPPRGGWKLVIVDNNSSDATRSVLHKYGACLPLEILVEPRPGKNRALNRALGALAGDLAVITDDDVLPDPDWLVRLREAADRHPAVSLFGGTILPEWPAPLPPWLNEQSASFGILFAVLRRASGPCDFNSIFGPNMAVRTAVFRQGNCFDEAIGPDATNPIAPMGSEWEFNRRLCRNGHRARFVAEARVRHIIRPEQFEERWILNRAYRNGFGVAKTSPPALALGEPRLLGLAWRLLLRRAGLAAAAVVIRPLPPSRWRVRLLFKERWFAGLAHGMARGGPRPARRGAHSRPAPVPAVPMPVRPLPQPDMALHRYDRDSGSTAA